MDRVLNRLCRAIFTGIIAASLATPALAGDPASGARVFRAQCSACHSTAARAAGGVGPGLFGVVDRKAGTRPGYTYSAPMKNSGLIWTASELATYLAAPGRIVHGTKMPYAGLHDPAQLSDLISFLQTLK